MQAQDAQLPDFPLFIGEQPRRAKPRLDGEVRHAVGRRIARLRQAAGLSQQGLAERLSTRQAAVAAWETGRAIPTPIFFRGLVRELNCTLDEIFFGAAAGQAR